VNGSLEFGGGWARSKRPVAQRENPQIVTEPRKSCPRALLSGAHKKTRHEAGLKIPLEMRRGESLAPD
jgi:hypothetical protein